MRKNQVRASVGIVAVGILLISASACSPEKRAWNTAEKNGNEYAYESYLAIYPQGGHTAAAKLKIEELAYQQASGAMPPAGAPPLDDVGTIVALREFLKRYPEGAFAAKARERLEDLEWEAGAARNSIVSYEDYLTAYPQGRHGEEARARIKAVLDARPPEWRDVRIVKFVLRQSFDEEVKDVTIGFEGELDKFFPFIGIRKAGPDAPADAVLTVACNAEAMGGSYSMFAFSGGGTFYYTGARVSGRAVLEIPGKKAVREDFDGTEPVPGTISGGRATEASGAPFGSAMRKDFPRKAGRLLARAFGYVPMIGALASRDADIIAGAVLALQSGGAAAFELLLQAVEHPDVGVRVNAARALKGHMNVGSIAALVKCLGREGDAEREVRSAAADSLAALGVLAVPALAEASKDGRAAVRQGAATALGRIRTAPSLALLAALFDDAEKPVRETAIRSAGEHKSRAAVSAMIDRLGTALVGERDAWLSAIGNSLEATVVSDEEDETVSVSSLDWDRDLISRFAAKVPGLVSDAGLRDKAAGLFYRLGDAAWSVVGPMLRAEPPAVRIWAADVLGRIGDAGAVRFLVPAAGDADAGVRREVAKSLGSFDGEAGIVEPLGRLFMDASPDVASAALLSLGKAASVEGQTSVLRRHLSSPDKIKLLIDKLSLGGTPKNDEKDAAALVLGTLGRAAVGPLASALKGGTAAVRKATVEALGKTGDSQAGTALAELAKDPTAQADNELMAAIYRALGATKSPQALEILSAGVKDALGDRHVAAINGLRELGNVRGVDALVALLPTENSMLANEIDTALRELTKYEPEDEKLDWKGWWAKNRARYGLK
jgi:HEAT repeat protein